jgi:DNA polymerase III epsilon subunit-like protein
MKKYKPYVALDLETTGLDHNSDILEIGAVFDDGSPLENLDKFHVVIKYEKYKHAEPYAVMMNRDIIKESVDVGGEYNLNIATPHIAFIRLNSWLSKIRESLTLEGEKLERLYIAGKNVAGFDIPVLKKNSVHYLNSDISRHFTHRTIDVGSLYFDVFGENVTLGKINELTGRAENVSHRALDDALDIVHAIRYKMKD